MQGKKDYQEKLFLNFKLSDRVPKENFYRRLKDILNLSSRPCRCACLMSKVGGMVGGICHPAFCTMRICNPK